MVKVAVHTTLKHASLVPHFCTNGRDNALTDWMHTGLSAAGTNPHINGFVEGGEKDYCINMDG
jgi:hypothetical protein